MSANIPGTMRRLDDVAAFSVAIARVQQDIALTAGGKVQAIYEQLETCRTQLAAQGLLDDAVAQQLATLAQGAVAELIAVTGAVSQSLHRELAAYTPKPVTREERIKHFWQTKVIPWWNDNSW